MSISASRPENNGRMGRALSQCGVDGEDASSPNAGRLYDSCSSRICMAFPLKNTIEQYRSIKFTQFYCYMIFNYIHNIAQD